MLFAGGRTRFDAAMLNAFIRVDGRLPGGLAGAAHRRPLRAGRRQQLEPAAEAARAGPRRRGCRATRRCCSTWRRCPTSASGAACRRRACRRRRSTTSSRGRASAMPSSRWPPSSRSRRWPHDGRPRRRRRGRQRQLATAAADGVAAAVAGAALIEGMPDPAWLVNLADRARRRGQRRGGDVVRQAGAGARRRLGRRPGRQPRGRGLVGRGVRAATRRRCDRTPSSPPPTAARCRSTAACAASRCVRRARRRRQRRPTRSSC